MATVKQPIKKVATTPATKTIFAPAPKSEMPFLFSKENYTIMIAGVVIIIVGFLLMLGVNNTDPAVFPADEIYSFRRITLAPIVVMLGFAIEIYAILKKPAAA